MINQQEGTQAGVSGNDLGTPFSLLALCEELVYSPTPLAGGGTACGHRALSGGQGAALLIVLIMPVYTADANGGLCIGRSCVRCTGGLGGAGHQ